MRKLIVFNQVSLDATYVLSYERIA